MIDNLVAYEFFKDADYYGVCETAANTAAKVVTIPDFTLENGVGVMVKFKNGNTANSPTLTVSGTGAKPIYINPSVGTSVSWEAWKVLPFVYDGTNWQLVYDPGIAVTQIPTDESDNNYEVLFSKSPDNTEHNEEIRKSQYFTYNPKWKDFIIGTNSQKAHFNDYCVQVVGRSSEFDDCSVSAFAYPELNSDPTLSVVRGDYQLDVHARDITLSNPTLLTPNDTWDGYNTSLKTAINKKIGTFHIAQSIIIPADSVVYNSFLVDFRNEVDEDNKSLAFAKPLGVVGIAPISMELPINYQGCHIDGVTLNNDGYTFSVWYSYKNTSNQACNETLHADILYIHTR